MNSGIGGKEKKLMCEEMEYVDVDTIEIPLEDGSVMLCAILEDFELNGRKYYALAPIEGDEIGDDTYFYNYEEDGEDIIMNYIDDEAELRMVYEAYLELLAEDEEEE